VVYGSRPTRYNEIVLVLDENNELDDITLYALGLKSKADIDAIMKAAMAKTHIEPDNRSWSYETICGMEYRTVLPSACFTKDESTGLFVDLRETDTGLRYLYDNGITLKVSGIIRPNEDAVSGMLTGAIGYTHALTTHIIEAAKDSAAVQAQLESLGVDIFTGLPFKENMNTMTEAEKLCDHIALLNEGHIIEYGNPREICRRYNHQKRIQIHLADGTEMDIPHDENASEIVAELLKTGQAETIHTTEPNLETVFLELTGKELSK
jgi:putative ABC transport system permease protein